MEGNNPLFQILADSHIYRQHRIRFWGTPYDIKSVISADIETNITDMADIADINGRYWQYWKPPVDTDTKILNHEKIIVNFKVICNLMN